MGIPFSGVQGEAGRKIRQALESPARRLPFSASQMPHPAGTSGEDDGEKIHWVSALKFLREP